MGELGLSVDIRHSADRVWAALVDSHMLRLWFMENDFEPFVGRRSTFWPGPDLPGLDEPISAVVLAVEPGRRLTMAWHSDGRHTEMVWRVEPNRRGSLLTVHEEGTRAGRSVEDCRRAYATLFAERLPALLDQEQSRPRRRGKPLTWVKRVPARRWKHGFLGACGALVALVALWISVPVLLSPGNGGGSTGTDGQAGQVGGAPDQQTMISTSGPVAGPLGSDPTVSAAGPTSPGESPGQPEASPDGTTAAGAGAGLAADYRMSASDESSQTYEVTITNPTDAAITGWQVAFQITGSGLLIKKVSGAKYHLEGTAYVFTPKPTTAVVPANASIVIGFTVTATPKGNLGGVTSCLIDGRSCTAG